MSRYAFHFDSSACAGCKACQIACKDKHGLEVGILWRRVYEVTGGEWGRTGDSWVPDLFAFHLSIGCNHCARPICVEVCPSRALRQRDDGIVLLDSDRCIGCSYCEWACPYGAPQYDAARGCMTKCSFCVDEIDEGREPVCVTACPLRVLEFGAGKENESSTEVQTPLPDRKLTEPALVLQEHRDAARAREERIEVVPRKRHELHEWSLVAFTILAHLAAGTAMWTGGLRLFEPETSLTGRLDPLWLVVVSAMAMAMLTSLRHLGSPARAYRALSNLRTSWLGREIFTALSFTLLSGATLVVGVLGGSSAVLTELLGALTALCGFILILVIARVYMLRTVATWNTTWTPISFLTTSLLLGSVVLIAVNHLNGTLWAAPGWMVVVTVLALLRKLEFSFVERRTARLVPRGEAVPGFAFLPSSMVFLGLPLLYISVFATSGSGALRTSSLLLAIGFMLGGEALDRHRFFKFYSRCGI
jgi:DMSO reductase iron-sulfur subunit